MDEVKFTSKLMRGALSKLISNTLKKRSGVKVDISINDFGAFMSDGLAHVHIDLDAEMTREQLTELLKNLELF